MYHKKYRYPLIAIQSVSQNTNTGNDNNDVDNNKLIFFEDFMNSRHFVLPQLILIIITWTGGTPISPGTES